MPVTVCFVLLLMISALFVLKLCHCTKSLSLFSSCSLSAESNNADNGRSPVKSTPSGLDLVGSSGQTLSQSKTSKPRRRGAEWEIIDGFKTLQLAAPDQIPNKIEEFLLKKRKWPLKGWHKVFTFSISNVSFDYNMSLIHLQRFFILDKGNLMYAKRPADLARGKPHGSVDLGMSVISAKKRRGRIDIDAEVFIYHIKVERLYIYSSSIYSNLFGSTG